MSAINPSINASFKKALARLVPIPKTATRYTGWWKRFLEHSGVNENRPPTEEDFQSFLEKERTEGNKGAGVKGATLWTFYSGLNTVHLSVYGHKLDVSKLSYKRQLSLIST